jgi:MshEN domain
MLLAEGRITRDQFEQATVRKARTGETVGFHLIAIGAIGDEELVEFFTRHFSLRYWPRYKLENVTSEAIEILSPELAAHLRVLPIRMTTQNLTLGLTDPSMTHVAEEAAYHTKRLINPVLITESAMTWALDKYYSPANSPIRHEDTEIPTHPILLTEPLTRQTANMRAIPRNLQKKQAKAPPDMNAARFSKDEWTLDQWSSTTEPAVKTEEQAEQALPLTTPKQRVKQLSPVMVVDEPEEDAPIPLSRPPEKKREAASIPPGEPPEAKPEAQEEDVLLDEEQTSHEQPIVLDSVPPERRPNYGERLPSSGSGGILNKIHKAKSRDEIVDLALDYLMHFAGRAAFAIVKKNEIRGFSIKGEYTSKEAIQAYWVPLSADSTMHEVAVERQIHLGPLGRSPADAILAAALGGRPGRILVIPIEIRNRVIGILFADHLIVDMPPWGNLERLAEVVGTNLTRLILRRGAN